MNSYCFVQLGRTSRVSWNLHELFSYLYSIASLFSFTPLIPPTSVVDLEGPDLRRLQAIHFPTLSFFLSTTPSLIQLRLHLLFLSQDPEVDTAGSVPFEPRTFPTSATLTYSYRQ